MTKEEQQKLIEQKVLTVADYVIDEIKKGNNPSTRSVAADFTKAFNDRQAGITSNSGSKTLSFKISNATVCVYLSQKLPKIDPVRYKLVKPIIDKNTPKSIEHVLVLERMYVATELLLRGLTIPQIVEELNASRDEDDKVTFDIIYDDLTTRLNRIETNQQLLADVKNRLKENRIDTLNNQKPNGPNMSALTQPRNSQGRFASNDSEVPRKCKK